MPIILGNDQIFGATDGSLWNQKWSKVLQSPLGFDLSVTRGFVYGRGIGPSNPARLGIYELDAGNVGNSTLVAQSAIVSSSIDPNTPQWNEFAFNGEILTGGKTYIISFTLGAGGPTIPYYDGSPGFTTQEFRTDNNSAWPNFVDPHQSPGSTWTNRDSCMYLECEDASIPLLPPEWSTIPAQNTTNSLPRILDVTPYAMSSSGPLVNWQLVSPPAGFTMDSGTGVITCAAGTEANTYAITARVSNDDGTSNSDPFAWTVNAAVTSTDFTAVGTTTAVLRYTVPFLPATIPPQAFANLRASGSPKNSNVQVGTLALPVALAVPGTIYAAIRTTAPYTDTDQAAVKAGTGAVWFENKVAQFRQSFLAHSLPPDTVCYYGMYDEADTDSFVTHGQFTTQAEPAEPTIGTPPNRRS